MAKKKNDSNIENLKSSLTASLYGVSQDFLDNNVEEINSLRDTLNRINTKNEYIAGANPIEFLTKMAYNDHQNNIKSTLNSLPKNSKGKIDLNAYVNGMTLNQINEIYAEEMDRISRYTDYEQIVKYIPQIAQGISIWTSNILSPDDFNKTIFNVVYDDILDEELRNKVEENINEINDKYNIEEKAEKWITDTLIKGDQFIALLRLDDEFDKIFKDGINESGNLIDESINLSENEILINESEINELKELYKKKSNKKEEINNEEFISSIKTEMSNIINNNIKFTTSPISIIEEDIPILKSMQDEIDKKNKYANIKDYVRKELDLSKDGTLSSSDKSKKLDKDFINGSYIKTLEPDRVVKIKIAETVYGYFYIEIKGKNEIMHPKNMYSMLTLRQTVDLTSNDTTSQWAADPKLRLISDLFARNISKKIDKEFIANNKEFKNIIYDLLKQDYLYNNNIQITFFEPDIVKHLMVKEDKDGYGISVLEDIIFTAKLYLSVLITTLLTKISRSQEHRTYYIETGLSEDIEGIVNAFIRDVKTKDVKVADTQSIDSIFTTIGSCSEFFIPQVNGEKAVEIDTTPGYKAWSII